MLIPATAQPALVRCFYDEHNAGSLARVQVVQAVPGEQAPAAADGVTQVFVCAKATSDGDQYEVASYGPTGQRINFCGHGALAAAQVLLGALPTSDRELRCINHQHRWLARRTAEPERVALVYTRPQLQSCAVPAWASDCFQAAATVDDVPLPIAAAEVGGERDYLILEYASADELARLQPDAAAICGATQRAIIVTAADGEAHFVFRYFAPQYTTVEDAATGSAAVQLGAYWGERLPGQCLHARQLSPGGACMQVECSNATVEISGRVAYSS